MAGAGRFQQAVKTASNLIVAGTCAALLGCGPAQTPPGAIAPKGGEAPAQAQSGYVTPPGLAAVERSQGRLVLRGAAEPGARVRLATPGGEPAFATADSAGAWRLAMPPPAAPTLYGLSMAAAQRQVQAQGYILLSPDGRAALMRAGAGVVTLQSGGAPRITALDFDAEGGAVASGVAPPETPVTIRADGRQVAEGRSDAAGRFSIAFNQPIAEGRRQVEAVGEDWQARAVFEVTPAEPVAGAPYRAAAMPGGVRVDWMTPGGGLQSSLILD
jgi:hypothetical protein